MTDIEVSPIQGGKVSNSKAMISDILKTVVLPLAVVFLIEPFYREPLYKESLDLAPELQKYDEWKGLMQVVSFMGAGKFYAFILIASLNILPKLLSLYLFCGISFANYSMNQLKSFYGEPRPYWMSDHIEASHCGTGFGNPSGHMLNNCFFWVTAYLHIF